MSRERIDRVRRLCAGWVEEGNSPALQVVVARRGTIVLHDAWGRLGPEDDDPPLTTDSIFPLASITKPITAAAVMCLVEDGLLGLNRPVQEYLPEFVGDGKDAVMVHHLLTHTSGLTEPGVTAYLLSGIRAGEIEPPEPLPGVGPDEFLFARCRSDVYRATLSQPSGSTMSYSSPGYVMLAEIVARIAGRPAASFVQKRILDPLGMDSTSFASVPGKWRDRYVRRPASAPLAAFMNNLDLRARASPGAGTASGTARDAAAFTQMLLNGGTYGDRRVLSRASVREMTRNQIPGVSATWAGEHFPEASWGYGWGIQGDKKSQREPSLLSSSAFIHGGVGMILVCADPEVDLVVSYLSVGLEMVTSRKSNWCADLVVNAAIGAIVD